MAQLEGKPAAAMAEVEELTELVSAWSRKYERASTGDLYGLTM